MAGPIKKNNVRYTAANIKAKTKMGGRKVVSEALVKKTATNHVPKVHVKVGDLVMVISGPRKNRKYKDHHGPDQRRDQETRPLNCDVHNILPRLSLSEA